MDPGVIHVYLCYILIINLIAFLLFGIDKYKAKNGLWRIPEKVLFLFAILGGSVGALIGMEVFRHKTKHLLFWLGLPVILCLQIILGIVLYANFFCG